MLKIKDELLIKQFRNLEIYFLKKLKWFSLKKQFWDKKFVNENNFLYFEKEIQKYNFLFNKFWKYFDINKNSKLVLDECLNVFCEKWVWKKIFNYSNWEIYFIWTNCFLFDVFLIKFYKEVFERYSKKLNNLWKHYILDKKTFNERRKKWNYNLKHRLNIWNNNIIKFIYIIDYLYKFENEKFNDFIKDFWIFLIIVKIYIDSEIKFLENEYKSLNKKWFKKNEIIINKKSFFLKEINVLFDKIYKKLIEIYWNEDVEKWYEFIKNNFFTQFKVDKEGWDSYYDNYYNWINKKEDENHEKFNSFLKNNSSFNTYINKEILRKRFRMFDLENLWIIWKILSNFKYKFEYFEIIIEKINENKEEIIKEMLNCYDTEKLYEENRTIEWFCYMRNRLNFEFDNYNLFNVEKENFTKNSKIINEKIKQIIRIDHEIYNWFFQKINKNNWNYELIEEWLNSAFMNYKFSILNVKWRNENWDNFYDWFWWIHDWYCDWKNLKYNNKFNFYLLDWYIDNQILKYNFYSKLDLEIFFYELYINLYILYEKIKLSKEIKNKWVNNMFEDWNVNVFEKNKEKLIKEIDFLINDNKRIFLNEMKFLKENWIESVIWNLDKKEKFLNEFLFEYEKIWNEIIKELKEF